MKHLIVIGLLLLCCIIPAYATSNNGTFEMTYSNSYAPGQRAYNHATAPWTLNSTAGWYMTDTMMGQAGTLASWSFASQYFDTGSYTGSYSGTIKFYNTTARDVAHYVGEGTLSYTYLGSNGYGAVSLVMTEPLLSGSNFYTGNKLYTTISDSNLAGIGSTYIGVGYGASNAAMRPECTSGGFLTEGPATGAAFGYNYFTFSGNWKVDYTSTSGLINTYNLTPVGSSYRYWVEGADGTILTSLTAFSGNAASGITTQRARVFVQDPLYNSTDFYFWVGVPSTYNLTMSPKNITATGTSTALILSSTGSFADIGSLSYVCNPGHCKYSNNEPTFTYTGGTWKQWNATAGAYDIAYGSGFPGSIPLSFDTSGTISVSALLLPKTTSESGVTLYGTVDVGGLTNETTTLILSARESTSNGLVSGVTLCLKDDSTGIWTNKTSTSGAEFFTIRKNTYYGYTATHASYSPASLLHAKFAGDSSRDIILYKPGSLNNPGNASTKVWIVDRTNLKGINGATVRFGDEVKTTPASGMVEFESLPATEYEIQAYATGYQGTVTTYTTGAAGSDESGISLELMPLYVTTPTPVPTDPGTGQPITTQQTIDTRSDTQKDADMASDVRKYAPTLIMLFIIGTIVGVLKLMGK